MSYTRMIIAFFVFLLAGINASGQENKKYIYYDSSIMQSQVVTGAEAVESYTDVAEPETVTNSLPDTALRFNHLLISSDSVAQLKRSKSLAAASNLDSLLRAKQRELQRLNDNNRELPGPRRITWLESFFSSPALRYTLLSLAVIFVGFVLYKLFFTQGFFQRVPAKSNVNELQAEAEGLSESADYDQLVTQAVTNGNYRLGVRYLYLQCLQKMSARGLIEFSADKTNYQYVREIGDKPYSNEFAALTLNYEYTWYGEFAIDEPAFTKIRHQFKQFNTRL